MKLHGAGVVFVQFGDARKLARKLGLVPSLVGGLIEIQELIKLVLVRIDLLQNVLGLNQNFSTGSQVHRGGD